MRREHVVRGLVGPEVRGVRFEQSCQSFFTPFQAMTEMPSGVPITTIREIRGLTNYESIRRALGVTHQAIAQAAWATVLQNYTKLPLTLGIVVSGRIMQSSRANGEGEGEGDGKGKKQEAARTPE